MARNDPTGARRPTALGRHLRAWRRQRGISQLQLALRADVSQRHVSFIETGRSRPRAEVVDRIAEALDVPLRERNALPAAAGLGPSYPELPLAAGPIAPVRGAIGRLLAAHEPFPAIVVDRWWDVVATNRAAAGLLFSGGDRPLNALDLFLGPGSLRDSIDNFAEVAWTFLRRLRREVADAGADARLEALLERAEGLMRGVSRPDQEGGSDLVVCPRFVLGGQVVRTVSMVARFGSAREVTLDELRVELVCPADADAEAFFRRAGDATPPAG
jgi:transcriptional regulator with XRE-family HTH domain